MKTWLPAALVIASWQPQPTAAPAVTASLSTWQTANGTGVRFVPLSPEVVGQQSSALPDETSGGSYYYGVDTSALSWSADCTCYRYYVILARPRNSNVVTRYKFKGIPSGSFPDQRAPVRLALTDPQGTHTDDIALPVASAPGLEPSPLLALKTESAVHAVSVGGVTELQVVVQNGNASETVDITEDVLVQPEHPAIWKVPPSLSGFTTPTSLQPRGSRTFAIRLEPKIKQAIGVSFPPTAQDVRHTGVKLTMPYASRTFSGREGTADVLIPLRFRPSILTLGMWLFGGVLLGSVIRLLSGGKTLLRQWPRAAGTAALVGVVLEVFGIILTQSKSKLTLFGFDIDPWQTTPVLLLGIVTGLMGIQAAKILQDWLKRPPRNASPVN